MFAPIHIMNQSLYILLQQAHEIWNTIWSFISNNDSALNFFLGRGILLLILGFIWWLYQQFRKRQIRPDTFPFDVIKPQSDVLKAILGGDENDPLADYKILYQERIPGRSIYDDLKRLLDESRWVLILAPTGWGKTREAANLAQKLNNEGWTVLKLTRSEWLDAPPKFPEDKIGTDRKLLFFLDDLNTKMYGGRIEQSPKANEPLQPLNVSLQERLLRAIDAYERFCRRENIRVIATVRNETEREFPDEPSEWEKLQFDKYPLWKRFKIYHLPEPNEEAIIGVLTETVPQANIQANPGDYPRLAQRNDGTFRNIVENLRSARNNHQPLALDTFRDTLKGTWKKRYQDAIKKYPAAKYIYDAVDLLRLAGIALYPFIIQPTALLIADRNLWYRLKHWWQIRVAFSYLIRKEQILTPRDGQIEAKGVRLEWNKYVSLLSNLVLKLANKHPKEMLGSLHSFGIELMLLGRYVEAITCYDKALKIQPDDYDAWSLRGYMAANLGRTEEAIAYYDKALSIRPDLHETWHNRGVGLARLGRYEDAIDSYDKALELKADLYYTWNARGIALRNLGRHEEEIASYDKAIAIKPDYEKT